MAVAVAVAVVAVAAAAAVATDALLSQDPALRQMFDCAVAAGTTWRMAYVVPTADEDVLRTYQLHAIAYVAKPVDLVTYLEAVRKVDEFYVSLVQLPAR